jgi:hypothetical protein
MKPLALVAALALAAAPATAVLAADAQPGAKAKPAYPSCFFSTDWQNWHGADKETIYLRVRLNDIYKVELSHGSSLVTDPTSHLVSIVRGSSSVCTPLDLDLKISDGIIIEPLFVKSLTRLTPDQVKAIPKKDLP